MEGMGVGAQETRKKRRRKAEREMNFMREILSELSLALSGVAWLSQSPSEAHILSANLREFALICKRFAKIGVNSRTHFRL
jgi:coenzyme F420-reducing hydrogenase delta subunit